MKTDNFSALIKQIAKAPSIVPKGHFGGTKRYEILRRLGSGGFGVVYEALDHQTETRVALKTLHQMGPHAIKRLKNEFRSLQDLAHPNLCKLGDLVEDQGEWFFTMELLEGTDFIGYCHPARMNQAEGATFDEQRLRSSLRQLSLALSTLHAAGKVHRDIKPSNVFVTHDHRCVLLDFGLITDLSLSESTFDAHTGGTAAYMSPEQAAEQPVDHKADCYAMGVLLFETLTGRLPFTGSSAEILRQKCRGEAPSPADFASGIPPDLVELCRDLLTRKRELRPTANAVLRRLDIDGKNSRPETKAFVTPSPLFVGRVQQLEELEEAFASSQSGVPTVVLIEGDSGIGKTALITHFSIQLQRSCQSAQIFGGRCYERESVPYKALDTVVDEIATFLRGASRSLVDSLIPRNAALLPRIFPVLGTVEVIRNSPMPQRVAKDPFESRTRAFQALRELIARLGEHKSLVIIIDDLQWADRDSWTLLGDLLQGPDAPKLLLVLLARPTGVGIETHFVSEWDDAVKVRKISLGPLEAQRAVQLAEALLEGDPRGRNVAEEIAREAEGHPLYISELIRHGPGRAIAEERPMLDEAIMQRIRHRGVNDRRILEFACLAGRPVPPNIVVTAAAVDNRQLWHGIGNLRQVNLIRLSGAKEYLRLEPFHDRVREVILLNMNKVDATSIHARLAVAWQEAGASSEMLLNHFADGAQIERAAECALDAAERASNALAFDRAAKLFETALNFKSENPETVRQIELKLAEAYANAGRGPEAARGFLVAADNANSPLRQECLRQAAEQWLVSGHIDLGLSTLEKLFKEIGDLRLPGPFVSLLSLITNRFWLRLRGYRNLALPAEEDKTKLTRLDAYESVTRGLGMVDFIRAADYQSRALLMALKTGDRLRVGKALAYAAPFLGSPGGRGHGQARKFLSDAAKIAEEEKSQYLTGIIEAIDGFLTLHEGKIAMASRIFERAEEILRFETSGTAWEVASTRILRLLSLRMQGRFPSVKALYERYMRDAARRGDRFTETTVNRLCIRLWMVEDNLEKAKRQIEQSRWVDYQYGAHLQHFLELEARVDACLYEGNPEQHLDEIIPIYQGIRHSMWFRVKMVRAETKSLWGRLWISLGARGYDRQRALKRAKECARLLGRENLRYIKVLSLVLRGGLASLEEDQEQTIAILQRIMLLAKDENMDHVRGAACYRLGQMNCGAERADLQLEAAKILGNLGVVRPRPFSEMLIPGRFGS